MSKADILTPMRFLLINSDYPAFLESLYAAEPGLALADYDRQMAARNRTLFGTADFYSRHLRELGHEAWDLHVNNGRLQSRWARDHGIKVGTWWPWPFMPKRRFLPMTAPWFLRTLEAQIEHYKPEVIFNHDLTAIDRHFWDQMRPRFRLLVGQHASPPLPEAFDYGAFDLIVSSFPPTLERFAKLGIATRPFKLGFEAGVLDAIVRRQPRFDVSFVGSFAAMHRSRVEWLERVCLQVSVTVFSADRHRLSRGSPILRDYRGPAWGREMYQVLADSRITLNHHGSVPAYANNLRLYEATGVGTMLLTDWKENLHEVFEPGREVAAYRDADECVALIGRYLEDEAERRRIASAGQARTLRDHTYAARMKELLGLLEGI